MQHSTTPPTDRHVRVASLIKEIVATFIQHEANPEPMITVTNIGISPDYRNATIFITTIPEGREEDAIIFLHRHGGEIRRHLMKKSNLKIIPHLEFAVDYGERHRQHTDEIFQKIHEEETSDQDTEQEGKYH